jgi:hypothetical protein
VTTIVVRGVALEVTKITPESTQPEGHYTRKPRSVHSPHTWPRGVPWGAFTAYEVRRKGELLGVVASMRETAERKIKGTRLVSRGGVSRYWSAQAAGADRANGAHYYQRHDAAEALLP